MATMGREPKKYLLCPGTVISMNDRQVHYIGVAKLAFLYGVRLDECEVSDPAQTLPQSLRGRVMDRQRSMIRLAPRYDGDYRIPATSKGGA